MMFASADKHATNMQLTIVYISLADLTNFFFSFSYMSCIFSYGLGSLECFARIQIRLMSWLACDRYTNIKHRKILNLAIEKNNNNTFTE